MVARRETMVTVKSNEGKGKRKRKARGTKKGREIDTRAFVCARGVSVGPLIWEELCGLLLRR